MENFLPDATPVYCSGKEQVRERFHRVPDRPLNVRETAPFPNLFKPFPVLFASGLTDPHPGRAGPPVAGVPQWGGDALEILPIRPNWLRGHPTAIPQSIPLHDAPPPHARSAGI